MSDDFDFSELKRLTDRATYSRLQKDLSAVKNDVAALAEQISDALNDFTGQAGKQARRGVKQARSRADDLMSDLQDRGSSAYNTLAQQGSAAYDAAYDAAYSMEESLEDAITQRPLVSVGLALGLGLLIGMTFKRS